MAEHDRVQLSSATLRGLAHPLRVRLLNLLRDEGPSTATKLAGLVGESSGSTSYHLRQLATYGFVEEDPERSAGRERWWRAAHRSTTMDAQDVRANPEDAEAYMRAVATTYAGRVDSWLGEVARLPEGWDSAATLSDYRLRLTAAEGTALLAELEAVIGKYRRDFPELASPDGAERVVVQLAVMPFLAGGAR